VSRPFIRIGPKRSKRKRHNDFIITVRIYVTVKITSSSPKGMRRMINNKMRWHKIVMTADSRICWTERFRRQAKKMQGMDRHNIFLNVTLSLFSSREFMII
jgi:hypothetical protein